MDLQIVERSARFPWTMVSAGGASGSGTPSVRKPRFPLATPRSLPAVPRRAWRRGSLPEGVRAQGAIATRDGRRVIDARGIAGMQHRETHSRSSKLLLHLAPDPPAPGGAGRPGSAGQRAPRSRRRPGVRQGRRLGCRFYPCGRLGCRLWPCRRPGWRLCPCRRPGCRSARGPCSTFQSGRRSRTVLGTAITASVRDNPPRPRFGPAPSRHGACARRPPVSSTGKPRPHTTRVQHGQAPLDHQALAPGSGSAPTASTPRSRRSCPPRSAGTGPPSAPASRPPRSARAAARRASPSSGASLPS